MREKPHTRADGSIVTLCFNPAGNVFQLKFEGRDEPYPLGIACPEEEAIEQIETISASLGIKHKPK